MKKQIIVILILIFGLTILNAQNYDVIELEAGAIFKGTLTPKNQNFKTQERVVFINDKNKEMKIPLNKIKTIKDSKNNILFPVPKEVVKAIELEEDIILAMYDTIYLKTSGKIHCNIILGTKRIHELDKISFLNSKGMNREMKVSLIDSIKNKKGEIIYSINEQEVIEKVVTPKNNCKKESESLKLEISEASLNRYNKIQEEIKTKTSKASPASYTMEEKVKEQVYNVLKYKIEKLKEFSTSIDAIITVKVDEDGHLLSHEDKVNAYQQLRNYTKIRDTEIYPLLENKIYSTNKIAIDYSGEYEKLYQEFENKIKSSNCPQEFDEILALSKKRFNDIEKKIVNTTTIYQIPIKYNFTRVNQKWTYYDGTLRILSKSNEPITVTKKKTKEDFLALIKYKQKNAKYKVNASYYSMLEDSSKIAVNSVKRKYKYLIHVGVTTQVNVSLPSTDKFNYGQISLFTYNAKVIFHRIGFFAGGVYNTYDAKANAMINPGLSGRFIKENTPLYVEGGLYVGLAQYFYLKGGYTFFNDRVDTYDNSVLISSKDETHHGFTAGMALIFPFVHVEWGYNFLFHSAYAGLGLHVTLNK